MEFCKNCGNRLNQGQCMNTRCGNSTVEYCTDCGAQNNYDIIFCTNCGVKHSDAQVLPKYTYENDNNELKREEIREVGETITRKKQEDDNIPIILPKFVKSIMDKTEKTIESDSNQDDKSIKSKEINLKNKVEVGKEIQSVEKLTEETKIKEPIISTTIPKNDTEIENKDSEKNDKKSLWLLQTNKIKDCNDEKLIKSETFVVNSVVKLGYGFPNNLKPKIIYEEDTNICFGKDITKKDLELS